MYVLRHLILQARLLFGSSGNLILQARLLFGTTGSGSSVIYEVAAVKHDKLIKLAAKFDLAGQTSFLGKIWTQLAFILSNSEDFAL